MTPAESATDFPSADGSLHGSRVREQRRSPAFRIAEARRSVRR